MKPDWDKLMDEYKGSATILVADVDCTADGKELCRQVGVRGYPTIKYGDPGDLQDYKGGRDLKALQKHAESLGPSCSPASLELCDEDKKKMIEEFMQLSAEQREAMIAEKTAEIEKVEAEFKEFKEDIQRQYKEASEKRDADVDGFKTQGTRSLGLIQAVHTYEKKKAKAKGADVDGFKIEL